MIPHKYYLAKYEYLPSGRTKRLARLRRCVESETSLRRQPQPIFSAVVAEDSDADEYVDDPGSGDFELSEENNTKQSSLAKAKVALRDFFPETWLFELDPVEGQNGLKR